MGQPVAGRAWPSRIFATGAILSLLLFTGCAGTPERNAYRVIGTTATTVDAAMKVWATHVAAGKASAADELKVNFAYAKYQNAARVVEAGVRSYRSNPADATALERALATLEAVRLEVLQLVYGLTAP